MHTRKFSTFSPRWMQVFLPKFKRNGEKENFLACVVTIIFEFIIETGRCSKHFSILLYFDNKWRCDRVGYTLWGFPRLIYENIDGLCSTIRTLPNIIIIISRWYSALGSKFVYSISCKNVHTVHTRTLTENVYIHSTTSVQQNLNIDLKRKSFHWMLTVHIIILQPLQVLVLQTIFILYFAVNIAVEIHADNDSSWRVYWLP